MNISILLLLATLLSGCTQLFFHPDSFLMDTPDRHGLEYRIENFQAADGTALNAWFLPARIKDGEKAKATVLFLHGNAENISTHFRNVTWLPAEGFNVLALDYRGYGASDGEPSLAGMQLDIDAAMRNLLAAQGCRSGQDHHLRAKPGRLARHLLRSAQRISRQHPRGRDRQRLFRLPSDRQRKACRLFPHLAVPVAPLVNDGRRLFSGKRGRLDQSSAAAADTWRSGCRGSDLIIHNNFSSGPKNRKNYGSSRVRDIPSR